MNTGLNIGTHSSTLLPFSPNNGNKKTVEQEIHCLSVELGLDPQSALRWLSEIYKPVPGDHLAAVASLQTTADIHFPEDKNPIKKYCKGVNLLFDKLRQQYVIEDSLGEFSPQNLQPRGSNHYHQGGLDSVGEIIVLRFNKDQNNVQSINNWYRSKFTGCFREMGAGVFYGACMLLTGNALVKDRYFFSAFTGDVYSKNEDRKFNETIGLKLDGTSIKRVALENDKIDRFWTGLSLTLPKSISASLF